MVAGTDVVVVTACATDDAVVVTTDDLPPTVDTFSDDVFVSFPAGAPPAWAALFEKLSVFTSIADNDLAFLTTSSSAASLAPPVVLLSLVDTFAIFSLE